MDISEILYECSKPTKNSRNSPEPKTQTLVEPFQNDQKPLADLLSLNTDDALDQILQSFIDIPPTELPSNDTKCNSDP